MIDLKSFMTYEKQLRTLQLQEGRLSRRREKETAELREVQQARKNKETEAMTAMGSTFEELDRMSPRIRREDRAASASARRRFNWIPSPRAN